MKVSMFRCGRCGKRYGNPLAHTCIVRLDRKTPPRRTRVKPRVTFSCGTCGKSYTNPLSHTCTVKTDFRKRKAAAERAAKRAKQQGKRRSGGQRQGDKHDYRECFYDSQGGRYTAASDCERFPCRIYREGHEHGLADGTLTGHAEGQRAGYARGYADGYAAAMAESR